MKLIIFLLAALTVFGCSKNENPRLQRMADDINENFHTLTNQVRLLEEETKELKNRILELEFDQLADPIQIDPQSTGYGIYDAKQTKLFVSTQKIEPYLDGYKVYLRIGNPSFVNFSGVTVRAFWHRSKSTNETSDAWLKTGFRSSTNKLGDMLYAGKWNSVVIPLLPCSADEVKRVTLNFEMDDIQLSDSERK